MNVSFITTVAARLGALNTPITKEVLETTIKDTFTLPDLEPRSYRGYQDDINEIATRYGLTKAEADELVKFIPDLVPRT